MYNFVYIFFDGATDHLISRNYEKNNHVSVTQQKRLSLSQHAKSKTLDLTKLTSIFLTVDG